MEAQLQRQHGHHHEDAGLQSGANHDHGEKRSVLKKVKEKTKKIKETIKKHVPGHGHDDDQDMINDHHVLGGSECESTVVRSKNLEEREHHDHRRHERDKKNINSDQPMSPNVVGLEENPHAPNNTPSNYHPTQPTGGISKESEVDDSQTDTFVGKISSASCAVADKAISAKNAVVSKLAGYSEDGEDHSSIPAYLSDKFRPGDEDKALSEVITGVLHKQKEAVWSSEEKPPPPPPRGKVTVSKEVAERLGPEGNKREGEDAVAAGEESSGQTVTERLTDAVSSWLGKSEGIQTAQDSVGNAFVNNSASSQANGNVQSQLMNRLS